MLFQIPESTQQERTFIYELGPLKNHSSTENKTSIVFEDKAYFNGEVTTADISIITNPKKNDLNLVIEHSNYIQSFKNLKQF